MTVATVIYYAGVHPYTLKPVYTAIQKDEKQDQHMFFFWYKNENKNKISKELRAMKREDLHEQLLGHEDRHKEDNAPSWLQQRRKSDKNQKSKKKGR
jgi:hypothetical protein